MNTRRAPDPNTTPVLRTGGRVAVNGADHLAELDAIGRWPVWIPTGPTSFSTTPNASPVRPPTAGRDNQN